MNAAEVLGFLLPQAELLQIIFLVLISAMFIFTIAATHLYAGEAAWERKWNGGTSDKHSDDLGIDHGSVTDICSAVATGPEKLAEVMPSLLLVVGLLGTFLGLGLALNHASNILGEPSALSASGAANSMQDLLGLLQGLGTKFKTSTWGITGFLLLKVWSSTTRFEEKRLTWSIRKVKAELEKRKALERTAVEAKQAAQFGQIGHAAGQIVEGFSQQLAQQVAKLMERDHVLHKHLLHYLEKNVEGVRTDLAEIRSTTLTRGAAIDQLLKQSVEGLRFDLASIQSTTQVRGAAMELLLKQSVEGVRQELAGINTATQASSAAMVDFATSTQSVINGMSVAGERMAGGADQVGVAASQLVSAVEDFKAQFTEVLNSVRTDLGAAIGNMSEQAARTLAQGSQELGNATREISTALGVLSNDVTATMTEVKGSIEKSLKIQQDGAVLFRRSSDTLNENVTETTELVKKLGEDIQNGLQAVSDSGRRMAGIGKSLDSMVPEILKLPEALQPLGEFPAQQQALLQEVQGLRQGLQDGHLLSNATLEVSKIMEGLSNEITVTMTDVKGAVENSLKIQQDSALLFRRSSDALNENATATTELVHKLGDDIHSGLQGLRDALRTRPLASTLTSQRIEGTPNRAESMANAV